MTRAAERVGVTQSSMSHTLTRLRELFNDSLLVRAGRGVVRTPRGEALLGPLQQMLRQLGHLIQGQESFSPSTSKRNFVLACPDLLGAVLPELLSRLREQAPHVCLEVKPLPLNDLSSSLLEGYCDVVLCPSPITGAGLLQSTIGSISWCTLARKRHPLLKKKKISAKDWASYPHIMVKSGNGTPSRVGAAMQEERLSREVGLIVPGFLLAMYAASRTDFLFTAPRELASRLASSVGLVALPPPIQIPSITVVSVWHERMHTDTGHQWFRAQIATVLRGMLALNKGSKRSR